MSGSLLFHFFLTISRQYPEGFDHLFHFYLDDDFTFIIYIDDDFCFIGIYFIKRKIQGPCLPSFSKTFCS